MYSMNLKSNNAMKEGQQFQHRQNTTKEVVSENIPVLYYQFQY